jgi:hypothetical protein
MHNEPSCRKTVEVTNKNSPHFLASGAVHYMFSMNLVVLKTSSPMSHASYQLSHDLAIFLLQLDTTVETSLDANLQANWPTS